MIHARGALALATLLFVRTAGAEPCVPRAALDGDAAAVASVAVELARLGVSTDARVADPRCPALAAAVELDRGGGIAVAVRDPSHRSEGRVVSDAALAAIWIDSWLGDDFEAPAMPESAPGTVPRIDVIAPVATKSALLDRISIAAAFEQLWTADHSRWSGASVAFCGRIGRICIGGRIAYATQDLTGDATLATRTDLSAFATVSAAQQLGRMSIAPELGIGVGRMTTQRIDGCVPVTPVNCDPMDPSCTTMPPATMPCKTDPSGVIAANDNLFAATITPRIEGALRIAVPLFDRVWLDGLAGVGFAPLGHSASYPFIGATMPNAPTPSTPGEPSTSLRFGVGLRVGLP